MPENQSAPAPEERPAGTAPEGAPPAQAASPTAAEREKALQDRLTQAGRDRKAAEDRAAAMQARLDQLSQGQAAITQHLTTQESAAEEQRIQMLPPVERAEAIARRAERKAEAQGTYLQQQIQRQEQVAYQDRRSRELIAQANAHFGLKGDNALTTDDLPAEAWTDERSFIAALNDRGGARVPRTAAPASAASASEESLEERVTKKVMQEMGVSRPLTPRAATASSPTTDADLQRTAWDAGLHTKGAGNFRKSLQDARDALREQAKAQEGHR